MRTNVLILGKSGVGKSSLLNYLWGDDVAQVGAGKPQTGEGVYRYDPIEFNNIDVAIFDSYGLEADRADRWHEIIDEEVKKHDRNAEPLEWFHTVIYCIDAKRARIEDFEVEEILRPLVEKGNRICFVLTKCDIASEEEVLSLRSLLVETFPEHSGIHTACCVPKKTLGGGVGEVYGREDLLNGFVTNFADNLFSKMEINYNETVSERLRCVRADIKTTFESDLGSLFSGVSGCFDRVEAYSEKKYERLNRHLLEEVGGTSKVCCELYNVALSDFLKIDRRISANEVHCGVLAKIPGLSEKNTFGEACLRSLIPLGSWGKRWVYKDDIDDALIEIEGHIKKSHAELVREIVLELRQFTEASKTS